MAPLGAGLGKPGLSPPADTAFQVSALEVEQGTVFKKEDFIYLLMRETHTQREAETQAEGEAGSKEGAQCGT